MNNSKFKRTLQELKHIELSAVKLVFSVLGLVITDIVAVVRHFYIKYFTKRGKELTQIRTKLSLDQKLNRLSKQKVLKIKAQYFDRFMSLIPLFSKGNKGFDKQYMRICNQALDKISKQIANQQWLINRTNADYCNLAGFTIKQHRARRAKVNDRNSRMRKKVQRLHEMMH